MRLIVRLFSVFTFSILFLTSILAQDIDESDSPDAVIIRQSNVRKKPSQRSPILQTLAPDSQIRVINTIPRNGYFRVLFGNGEQGYIYTKNIGLSKKFTKLKDNSILLETTAVRPTCLFTYAQCPNSGCAETPDDSDGLFNKAKRQPPIGRLPIPISFDDLDLMQKVVGLRLGIDSARRKLNLESRDKLKNIGVRNGIVSESTLVKIVGYIPLTKTGVGLKVGASESVNCNSTKSIEKDIHIPLTPLKSSLVFDGVIIEMIPQDRSPEWNLKKLRKIQTERKKVLVVGGLFYDNEHFVNNDPTDIMKNQPIRFSLWELHPIKDFYVCTRINDSCNPSNIADWTPLVTYR